jgi:hypothetical protein
VFEHEFRFALTFFTGAGIDGQYFHVNLLWANIAKAHSPDVKFEQIADSYYPRH